MNVFAMSVWLRSLPLMPVQLCLLCIGALAGLVKLADAVELFRRVITARDANEFSETDTWVFEWAQKRRPAMRNVINALFRAPVMIVLIAAILFCGSAVKPLRVGVAMLGVGIALNSVAILLTAVIVQRRRGGSILRSTGLVLIRAKRLDPQSDRQLPPTKKAALPGPAAKLTTASDASGATSPPHQDNSDGLDPLIVIPSVTGSIVIAYAALYRAMYLVDPTTFALTAHRALGVVDAIYFSLVTSATVGYGDIQPVTHGAQLAVMTQIIATTTGLALIAAQLLSARRGRACSLQGPS